MTDDDFMLPVNYKGQELSYTARLLNYGYSIKLEVEVEDTKLIFEPDEERNWRGMISYDDLVNNKKLSAELVQSIAEAIQQLTT